MRGDETLGPSTCHRACMTTRPLRTRQLDAPCPRCGGPLMAREVGIVVDQLPEPVTWATDRRHCAKGCPLTVADFPHGKPE